MPKIILPFSSQGEAGSPQSDMSEGDFYQLLPEALQEACKQNKHLLDYLRLPSSRGHRVTCRKRTLFIVYLTTFSFICTLSPVAAGLSISP